MDRRELLGLVGAGAFLSATTARAQQEDNRSDRGRPRSPGAAAGAHGLDKTHQECLEACGDCAKICDMTFHHCYEMVAQGKKEHAKSLHLVSDCAGFCSLSACMIAKHSPLMVHSCQACAEACAATAAEVGKFDDEQMTRAAKALKECERSCREMVRAMGGGHHNHEQGTEKTSGAERR